MGKKDKERKAAAADEPSVRPSKTERSADVMFRVVFGNHLTLSKMADTKAHIMIGICAAISAASVDKLFDPYFMIAAGVLLGFCLLAILFAVLSTMPRLGSGPAPQPDDPRFNLLFFGHFASIPYDEFQARVETLLRDQQGIHRSMLRDLYSMGKVLMDKKYRYLSLCYRSFLLGLVASLVTLIVTAARA